MKNHIDYKAYADNIKKYTEKIIYDRHKDEFYYLKGNDLLRLKPNGDCISLYPGAFSERVINVIKSGGSIIWGLFSK